MVVVVGFKERLKEACYLKKKKSRLLNVFDWSGTRRAISHIQPVVVVTLVIAGETDAPRALFS